MGARKGLRCKIAWNSVRVKSLLEKLLKVILIWFSKNRLKVSKSWAILTKSLKFPWQRTIHSKLMSKPDMSILSRSSTPWRTLFNSLAENNWNLKRSFRILFPNNKLSPIMLQMIKTTKSTNQWMTVIVQSSKILKRCCFIEISSTKTNKKRNRCKRVQSKVHQVNWSKMSLNHRWKIVSLNQQVNSWILKTKSKLTPINFLFRKKEVRIRIQGKTPTTVSKIVWKNLNQSLSRVRVKEVKIWKDSINRQKTINYNRKKSKKNSRTKSRLVKRGNNL